MADVPNATQMRDALAWVTQDQASAKDPDKNVWEWLWGSIQGDFSQDRSTGQIAFDAAISMIPVVDQICDVRDLIANCKAIIQSKDDDSTVWNWVALVLTLIGLFPSLGSLVKGVLKIFFLFVHKHGGSKVGEAVDAAMTWVITFLRKPDVQKYLRFKKIDNAFKWLADQVRKVRSAVSKSEILAAFDKAIKVMNGLLEKVTWMPVVGAKAKATIQMVKDVRKLADKMIAPAIKPVQDILDRIIHRLEMESLVQRSGILNANNVHFRGVLPEARAVTLMRQADPLPSWLSKGRKGKWSELDPASIKADIDEAVRDGWPKPTQQNIRSFHKMEAVEIKGPAKLYR